MTRFAGRRGATRGSLVGRRLRGRRLGDPIDVPVSPGTRPVRGRLAAVSVRAALAAGAWVGLALGLVLGALTGAALVWFSGAVVDWQRDLAFTLGVARRLLPFGDQLNLLRDIEAQWWIAIPIVAIVVAAVAAAIGALLAGIFAALYNRSPRHALIIVELPDTGPAGVAPVDMAPVEVVPATDASGPVDQADSARYRAPGARLAGDVHDGDPARLAPSRARFVALGALLLSVVAVRAGVYRAGTGG